MTHGHDKKSWRWESKETMIIGAWGTSLGPSAEDPGTHTAEHRRALTPSERTFQDRTGLRVLSAHTISLLFLTSLHPKPRALELLPYLFYILLLLPGWHVRPLGLLTGKKALNQTALFRHAHCYLMSVFRSHWLYWDGCVGSTFGIFSHW